MSLRDEIGAGPKWNGEAGEIAQVDRTPEELSRMTVEDRCRACNDYTGTDRATGLCRACWRVVMLPRYGR